MEGPDKRRDGITVFFKFNTSALLQILERMIVLFSLNDTDATNTYWLSATGVFSKVVKVRTKVSRLHN